MFTNCRHRGPLESLVVKLSQAISGLVVCLMAIQVDQAVCLAQHHAPPPPGAIRLGQPPMPGTQFQQPPRILPREDFSSEEEPVEEWVEEETPKKRKKETQTYVPVLPPSKRTLKAAPTPSEAYEIAIKKDEGSRNMDDWLAIADNWDKKLGEAKDNVEKSKNKLDSAQKELTSLNDKIPKAKKEFDENVEKKTRQFDTKYPHTVDAVESPDYGTERSHAYKTLQFWNDAIAQFQRQYPEREIPSQYIKDREFYNSHWEQTKGKGPEARDQKEKLQLEIQKMDRDYWNLIARQDAVSSSVSKLENEVYQANLAVFNADARKKESLTYADLRKPREITQKKEDVKTPKEEKKIEWTVYDPNYHQKVDDLALNRTRQIYVINQNGHVLETIDIPIVDETPVIIDPTTSKWIIPNRPDPVIVIKDTGVVLPPVINFDTSWVGFNSTTVGLIVGVTLAIAGSEAALAYGAAFTLWSVAENVRTPQDYDRTEAIAMLAVPHNAAISYFLSLPATADVRARIALELASEAIANLFTIALIKGSENRVMPQK